MKPRSPPCPNAESEFVSAMAAPRERTIGWTVHNRSIAFLRSCGRSFSEFNPDAQSKPPNATQFFQYTALMPVRTPPSAPVPVDPLLLQRPQLRPPPPTRRARRPPTPGSVH